MQTLESSPAAASSSAADVRIEPLFADHRMPGVVTPSRPSVSLVEWAAQNRALVAEKILHHGCLLFRGFGLRTEQDFEKAAGALCPTLWGEYGDLPRETLGEKIYGSTPYPQDKSILFHNEASHTPRFPLRQFFFCVKAATSGGTTPIIDCRDIAKKLDPALLKEFAEKGLLYVRNFADGIDVPWQKFFHTDDRAVVEAKCRADGMTCEWTEADTLRVKAKAPAVARHPQTGELVFFNQIQLHHVACLEPKLRAAMEMMFAPEDLPRNVYFGDGTPIPDEVVASIGELFERECKTFQWQDGDLVMVDNVLVSHARTPYQGPRKIVVAMGEMFDAVNLPPLALS